MDHSASSVAAKLESSVGYCELTGEPLDSQAICDYVRSPEAGAISIFVGTTRNSFKGKVVTRLEYSAYSKLAIKTMLRILDEAHKLASRNEHAPGDSNFSHSVLRCALVHRLGSVPVGEPSIVIAVSSPHRKEAFDACEFILEEVKKRAQIWKREFYEGERDEDAQWKANAA